MSQLLLHPEHGVNPSLGCCGLCGCETNEIVLLGHNKGQKAPKRVMTTTICAHCRDNMKTHVALIQAEEKDVSPYNWNVEKRPVPTGKVVFLVDDAVRRVIQTEELLERVLERRMCYLDVEAWAKLGLDKLIEEVEANNPHKGKRLVRREFDFKRAWRELAQPGMKQLSQQVYKLLLRTLDAAGALNQDPLTFEMPWPEKPEGQQTSLREDFEAMDSIELAVAARVIYSYGHWDYGAGDGEVLYCGDQRSFKLSALQRTGLYWKFKMYADQVLTERLCGEVEERNWAKTGALRELLRRLREDWPKIGSVEGVQNVAERFVEEVWE